MVKSKKPKKAAWEERYTSLTIEKISLVKFHELHKRLQPNWKVSAFLGYCLDICEQSHCRECNRLLGKQSCTCKDTEKI